MYVLTTLGGGCIVDAVSQVSGGDSPLIAVAVMKKNRTNELLHQTDRFALSVLGLELDPQTVKTFGFASSRDVNKFAEVPTRFIEGVPVVTQDTLGYMVCEKIDAVENDTHTLFIGRLLEGDVLGAGEPMTYGYYQAHKEQLLQTTTEAGKTAWICEVCGYIYYGDTLPDGYTCPVCGVSAERFRKKA